MFSIGSKTMEAFFSQVSLLTLLFTVFNVKIGGAFRVLRFIC